MTLQNIHAEVRIDAPLQRVWSVLTGAGLVAEWLGCINFEPVVGQVFYMQPDGARRATGDIKGATHCQVEALEPPRLLRFSWFMPGTPKTYVDITLTGEASGPITAALVHSGWDQFKAEDIRAIRDMLDGGWRSFVLPNFKRVAEAA